MKQLLMIDDDEKLGKLVASYLAQFGFEVSFAADPEKGLELLRRCNPEVLILDVMLPGKDGFHVCREVRAFSQVPIIMLTARGELSDRVVGLELGADDYLSKPFEPRELVARIQAILRRGRPATSNESPEARMVTAGELRVDLPRREAALSGKTLDLTTTEFDILALFLAHPGVALSREQIMDKLRGINWEAYNRSVDVAISRLRQKLRDDPRRPKFFKTVWGTGYLFIGFDANHENGGRKS